jgi:hypothetical protein
MKPDRRKASRTAQAAWLACACSPSRLGGWKKPQRPQPPESAMLQALNRFTP